MHIRSDMLDADSVDFPCRLKLASPIRIDEILTENGSAYTARVANRERSPAASMHSAEPGRPPTIDNLRCFVTLRDFFALATCYAELNGGARPEQSYTATRIYHDWRCAFRSWN